MMGTPVFCKAFTSSVVGAARTDDSLYARQPTQLSKTWIASAPASTCSAAYSDTTVTSLRIRLSQVSGDEYINFLVWT